MGAYYGINPRNPQGGKAEILLSEELGYEGRFLYIQFLGLQGVGDNNAGNKTRGQV
jgi:hypothetical protein